MEIFNRPPSISEDTLQYTFYPNPSVSISESACIALGAQIRTAVQLKLPESFFWHKDAFEVKIARFLPHEASDLTPRWKLEGTMRIGDSLDDEWCMVWLLREISSTIDVAVSVSDSDGEFLLIEAADALPKWISPSNSENRVWIYRSQIHLIPIHFVSKPSVSRVRRHSSLRYTNEEENGVELDGELYIGVADALRIVSDLSIDTVAPKSLQTRISGRISGYPQACHTHMHRARVFIPSDIALALSEEPSLVQRAAEAFYTRDAIQLRPVHQMSRFPPSTSIFASVMISRVAYAQLVGQNFHPPRVFGRWAEKESNPEWKAKNLGMKIACGFEMLYAETKSRSALAKAHTQPNLNVTKAELTHNKKYREYVRNLQKIGYFGNELEGSQKWKEAEARAIGAWLDVRRPDDVRRPPFANALDEAVETAKKRSESTIFDLGEDSDLWMQASPDELGDLFDEQASTNPKSGKDNEETIIGNQALKLKKLAGQVEAFVQKEGDLEGARFDDDELQNETSDSESIEDEEESVSSEDQKEDIEVRTKAMAALVPPLPASEYGIIPPKYSNSQPFASEPRMLDCDETNTDPGPSRPTRRLIFQRDKFDGVDSDDESDPDDLEGVPCEEISEDDEDQPTIVGEIEVDMEAEKEDFIQFTRDILGIDAKQWDDIVKDRQKRGAFVPSLPMFVSEQLNEPRRPPNLDSFENLMVAMDFELQKAQSTKESSKGKAKAPDPVSTTPLLDLGAMEMDAGDDIEARMETELQCDLKQDVDSEDETMDPSQEYNLIKNFLKSYTAQNGLSGPVSNMMGRLNENSSKKT